MYRQCCNKVPAGPSFVLRFLILQPKSQYHHSQSPLAIKHWIRFQNQPTVTRFIHQKSHSDKPRKKAKQDNPFLVLGVKQDEQYSVVKRCFLELAMKYHPDTARATKPEEIAAHRDLFISFRKAFEAIAEGPNGLAILRSESDQKWEEEELNDWFKQNSGGFDMPYMDARTIKEVAEMTHKIGGESGGLDRDGGMWTLARMITQNVDNGGSAEGILQLEAGVERNRLINGILRRKRKT